jgi:hypothetical protein
LKPDEHDEFTRLLTATMEVYGFRTSAEAIGIWTAALARYSLADVRGALSAHVQTPGAGKFAPKPADIIGLIQSFDGRAGAEEAWARLSHAIGDEGASVVLTEEERTAFFVADAIGDDKIAARMAFKEAYAKAVQEARSSGTSVVWSHILGHDPARRETALLEALRLGRLEREQVAALLPYRELPPPAVLALVAPRETVLDEQGDAIGTLKKAARATA